MFVPNPKPVPLLARAPIRWPLAKATRVLMKSPQVAKKKKPGGGCTGIGHLKNGEPFICLWPSSKKPISLVDVPRQSVAESADWISKDGPTG